MKKIRNYFKTHFSASFALILVAAFSAMLLFFQGYLRQVYFQYLLALNYEEENTIIHYVQENLNQTLKELVFQGSRTAVNSEIYQAAAAAETDEGSARMNDVLTLTDLLKRNINAGNAAVEAIASPDGLIAQYDRLKMTTQTVSMWSNETYGILQDMISPVTDETVPTNERTLPRVWIYTEPSVHPSYREEGLFHIVLPLTGGTVSAWDTRFSLVSTYPAAIFTDILDSVNIPQVDYIEGYITGSDGERLYSSLRDVSAEPSRREEGAGTDSRQRLLTEDLDYFGWKLNIEIDEEAMWNYVSAHVQRVIYIGLIFLALVMLVLWILFNYQIRPVRLLSESMKRAEEGALNEKIPIGGKHEIWQVAEEYNRMLGILKEQNAEIERQHQRTLNSIEQQHEAEWEALESQINAHFICNTLGCINYEAMEAGNHEVSQLLKKLSNILRYTFDQKRQEVMLDQEIAWVDQYLCLQKLRREDLFDYSISYPEVYGQWPCCKLMFQPFVENSIIHGFEGMESGGRISIVIDMEDDRLKIDIEDNGCGMDPGRAALIRQMMEEKDDPSMITVPEKTDICGGVQGAEEPEERERTGVGIRNVLTRMRMFFGKRFDAELWTEEGKGTRFTFRIPLPDTEEDTVE